MQFQRKLTSEKDDSIQAIDNANRAIADTEIINIAENALREDVEFS